MHIDPDEGNQALVEAKAAFVAAMTHLMQVNDEDDSVYITGWVLMTERISTQSVQNGGTVSGALTATGQSYPHSVGIADVGMDILKS